MGGWKFSSSLHLQGKLHNQWHWSSCDSGSDCHQLPPSSQDERVGEAGSLEGCYQVNMVYQGLENPCPFPSPMLFNPLELSLIPLLLSWLLFFLESSSPFHSPTCHHLCQVNFPLCVPAQLRPHFSQRAHCSSAPHVDSAGRAFALSMSLLLPSVSESAPPARWEWLLCLMYHLPLTWHAVCIQKALE